VIKASGGKTTSGLGNGQHNNSQMGSNRHMSNPQSRNNEAVVDVEDSGSEQSSDGEEPPDMRVYPEFLKNLPGVQVSDSMGYRIEALRVYLET